MYVLAVEPGLLEPLRDMLQTHRLATGGASAADIEYANMEPFFYGTVLLHHALRGGSELEFWRSLPDKHRHFGGLARVRAAVLKASKLL